MPRILRQTTVVRDGWHNAFTDLRFWQDLYWVGYRRGAAHASIDGEACVSVSQDRQRFREAARVKVAGDCRDPKLVPMGPDRIAMVFPVWLGGYRKRNLQQYVAFSRDGFNWDQPRTILEPCRWLWRVVAFGGRYYGACYRFPGGEGAPREYVTEFLVSDDLVTWETLSAIGTPDMMLGETGLHFFDSGEAWAVTRSAAVGGTSRFSRATPPYRAWETSDLGVLIHSPVIVEHNGALFVSGRCRPGAEGDATWPFAEAFSLGVWRLEAGKVSPVLRIPAAGDCSYPGLIKDPDGRVCMSYYSQHAYLAGVVEPPARRQTGESFHAADVLPVSDVFFAELEL